MRRIVQLAVVTLIALTAGFACKAKSEPAAPAPTAPAAAPSAPASTSATAPTPAPAAAAAAGEIGVPECDDYLQKWESCITTKITGEAKEQVKVALDATREGWKRTAAIPEGKTGLAAACREAAELAKMQVSAYGCSW
jgi:hypothetical protein